MTYFPAQPIIEGQNSGMWRLMDDYCVDLHGWALIINRGFEFDGASIPRICWRMVGHPMQLPMLAAAITHDALYASEIVAREIADRIFRDLMQELGIGWAKRNAVYFAVRSFGGLVWRNHTQQSVDEARESVGRITCMSCAHRRFDGICATKQAPCKMIGWCCNYTQAD